LSNLFQYTSTIKIDCFLQSVFTTTSWNCSACCCTVLFFCKMLFNLPEGAMWYSLLEICQLENIRAVWRLPAQR
ncbi:hypothetical protein T02_913, partial [Trichinella nativa]